ncbi:MAG TPA: efflux RND transporter periplasmic adaptor subunit [Salinivirgaceae bacterium]|nr:efflux RND transporter periplasmic adaptor subunit [Salinivirgaceae bacterium]
MIKRFLSLLCAIPFFWGCTQNNTKPQEIAPRVRVEKVAPVAPESTREFPGKIKEYQLVRLSFKVAGPIQRIWVNQGAFVKKGELLAEIDNRDYTIQYEATKAEYDKIIAETSRVIELYNKNGVSEADYQKAIAGQKMITSKLQYSENQLNDTKLYAPFSGYIQQIYFKPGEIVNIGMPVLEIIDVSRPVFEVFLPAEFFILRDRYKAIEAMSLMSGDTIAIVPLENEAKASGGQLIKAMFTSKNPTMSMSFIPGTEITIRVTLSNTAENNILIPIQSIFYRDNRPFVWVYNSSDSTVQSKQLEIVKIQTDGKVIARNLEPEETIVVSGVNALKENTKVLLIERASKTNIGRLL